jgi:FKBP-type peptidyl-prolyl cis-trans isomerase FkpA
MQNKLIYLFVVVFLFSCKEEEPRVKINESELKKSLIEINKDKVRLENEQIDNFVKRYGWPVEKTGTGLRYYIYEQGTGDVAKADMIATIDYCVTLLSGDTAYTSNDSGPQEFLVNMDNVESGLHEGIQYMQVGDRAKLILPSYLAHGLLGDSKKIPPRTSIVYDVKLISIR